MKKLLQFGLAVFGLIALFGSAPAMAYTPKPPCTSYTSGTGWPYNGHAFICTTNSNSAKSAFAQANSYPANLLTQFSTKGIDLFVFDTIAQYNVYPDFAQQYVVEPGASGLGASIYSQGTNHPAPVIAVFINTANWTTQFSRVLNHESGHGLDYAYASTSGVLPSQNGRSMNFTNLVNTDLTDFDATSISVSSWLTTYRLDSSCLTDALGNPTTNSEKEFCMTNVTGRAGSVVASEFFANAFCSEAGLGCTTNDVGTVLETFFAKGGMAPTTRSRLTDYVWGLAKGTVTP